MTYYSSKPLVESALLTAITVILAITGTAIPLFFFLLYILPLPIAIIIYRHGLKEGILAIAAATVLTSVLFGFYSGISVFSITILIAPALGFGFRHFSPVHNLIGVMVASVLSIALTFIATFYLMDINLWANMQQIINETVSSSAAIYKTLGYHGISADEHTAQIKAMANSVLLSLPTGVILSAMCIGLLNFILTHRLLKRLGETNLPGLPPFSEWKFPIIFLFLFCFSLVGIYWGSTRHLTILYNVSFNVNYFSSMFCRIQGLALMYFFLKYYKLSSAVKTVIFLLVLLTPIMEIVMYIGLFDMFFDYRTRFLQSRRDR